MKKPKGWIPFCLLALVLAGVLLLRLGQQGPTPQDRAEAPEVGTEPAADEAEFLGLRQREDQIVAYTDDAHVELYFHNPEDAPAVEIRPQVCFDGGYDLTEPIPVAPGETVTMGRTPEPEGIYYFVPGVWYGRILVFDAQSGQLLERVEDLEVRLYEHLGDDYDSIARPEYPEPSIDPEDQDYHTDFYPMSADLKLEEMVVGVSGLVSQDRDLDVKVWLALDGEDVLLAQCLGLEPHSMFYIADMLPGTAQLLEPDRVYEGGRVEVTYSDSGEVWFTAGMELRTYRSQ